jgi:hypothetical protein
VLPIDGASNERLIGVPISARHWHCRQSEALRVELIRRLTVSSEIPVLEAKTF